jgi:hypothetical protein
MALDEETVDSVFIYCCGMQPNPFAVAKSRSVHTYRWRTHHLSILCCATSAAANGSMLSHTRSRLSGVLAWTELLLCYNAQERQQAIALDALRTHRRLVRARKWVAIQDAPNVLAIHLKRFSAFSFTSKVSRCVPFKHTLQLNSQASSSGGCGGGGSGGEHAPKQHYMLTGVVVHSGGSLHSGHYVAYVRDGAGHWTCANDSTVYPVSLQEVLSQQAYLLFYSRLALAPLPDQPQQQPPSSNVASGAPPTPCAAAASKTLLPPRVRSSGMEVSGHVRMHDTSSSLRQATARGQQATTHAAAAAVPSSSSRTIPDGSSHCNLGNGTRVVASARAVAAVAAAAATGGGTVTRVGVLATGNGSGAGGGVRKVQLGPKARTPQTPLQQGPPDALLHGLTNGNGVSSTTGTSSRQPSSGGGGVGRVERHDQVEGGGVQGIGCGSEQPAATEAMDVGTKEMGSTIASTPSAVCATDSSAYADSLPAQLGSIVRAAKRQLVLGFR